MAIRSWYLQRIDPLDDSVLVAHHIESTKQIETGQGEKRQHYSGCVLRLHLWRKHGRTALQELRMSLVHHMKLVLCVRHIVLRVICDAESWKL